MIKEILGDSQLPEIKPNQQHYQNGTLEPQLTEEGVFSCIEMSTCVSQMILSLSRLAVTAYFSLSAS